MWILRHKWTVFVECCKLRVIWRGVVHDLSKFRRDEWRFYVEWYYGDRTKISQKDFDTAWLRHQNRNPHHWQFWLLVHDNGTEESIEMPDIFRREMLADWRALSGNNAAIRDAQLHPHTHRWIEKQCK